MHAATTLADEAVAAMHGAAVVPDDEVADPPFLGPGVLRQRRIAPELVAERLAPGQRQSRVMDYEEEWFLTPSGRELLEVLPMIDVVERHTKLGIAGGWIPTRMRRSSYVYSQNGSVHSNWNFDEYATMVAVTYLSKLLHQGEALSKTYASVDEIKARYRDREIKLGQKIVRLRAKPRKLFVLGSPVGLIQVYA